jgi:calcium-dependent protein kinase
VVRLVDHVEDDRVVYIVMELVGGGDLTRWLRQQKTLREGVIAAIFMQLLQAVAHCQAHNVVHRDLKPENILVYSTGAAVPRVCLCDFGLAALLESPDEVMTDVVGSAYFLSPEVLQQRYTSTCDLWSLGVNLYLMMCGSVPFGASAERTRDVHRAVLQEPMASGTPEWAALSPLAKDLIMGLLEKDPARRYTLREALAHRWFAAAGAGGSGEQAPPISTAVIKSMVSFVTANKLRAKALSIVAECLTAKEAAQLRAQFFQIDLNSDMNLSQAELGAALERMGLKMAAHQLTRFMAAIDQDGSGSINLPEFLAATAELSLQQHKDSAVRAFARFDRNGDGLISLEEARLALDVTEGEDAQLAELFAQYDTERGGALSFEMFWQMLNPTISLP